MTWLTTISLTFDSPEQADRAFEVLSAASDWDGRTITRRGSSVKIVEDYGERSKYDAMRPARSALREATDPLADSEFYEPMPIAIRLSTAWSTEPPSLPPSSQIRAALSG